MTSQLCIADGFSLPLDAVTETFAILAVKRSGKSNAAVVMAEEFYDAGVPWVAVDPKGDWWGVRAAGDGQAPGLSVLVLGGLHGDIPLEPTAGNLVADLVAEKRLTCVLDVSEMTRADQRRFLTDFASRLYRRNTEPLHVFCEEADEYIPQRVTGDLTKLVGAFETLVKRGGFRGIGITLITQRSASLNKDVLTQAGTLIAMRTPSPQDRKAVLAWVDYHDTGRDMVDELPKLDAGEAWVFSPQWLKTLTKIRFRRRRTFDSGATPKVGGKPRPPATLADVDLAAIKESMADTIERAKADDPKELRRTIADLQRQLHAATKRADELERRPAEPVVERVEVPVLDPAFAAALDEALTPLREQLNYLGGALTMLKRPDSGYQPGSHEPPQRERARPHGEASGGRSSAPASASSRLGETAHAERAHTRSSAVPRETRPAAAGDRPDVALKKGERQVLIAIASYPDGVTLEQLTVLTGYKRSSRNTYLQGLAAGGYTMKVDGRIYATEFGIAALGDDYEPLPTGAALRDYWLNRLPGGEAVILGLLVEAYPDGLTGDQIGDLTNYKRSSRNTYLQRLRARELVITTKDGVSTASGALFGGAS